MKAQRTGPSIGSSGDVTVKKETVKDKKGNEKTNTTVTFVNASKEVPFEYKIVKLGESIDISKGWKSSTKAGTVVSQKNLPKGTKILVRYKGIKANANKGIEAELPSAYATYTVG